MKLKHHYGKREKRNPGQKLSYLKETYQDKNIIFVINPWVSHFNQLVTNNLFNIKIK